MGRRDVGPNPGRATAFICSFVPLPCGWLDSRFGASAIVMKRRSAVPGTPVRDNISNEMAPHAAAAGPVAIHRDDHERAGIRRQIPEIQE